MLYKPIDALKQQKLNVINYKHQSITIFFVCLKVDQRAGQLSLPHLGKTKTERNRTTNIKLMKK